MKHKQTGGFVLAYLFLLIGCGQGQCLEVPSLGGTSFHLWQEGTGPFEYTDHYLSHETGIVLTLYVAPEHLANFAPNFRGVRPQRLALDLNPPKKWEIEYFCEPDYVLGIYPKEDDAKILYFNRLRWEKSLYFDARRDRLILTFRHKPQLGLINSSLTEIGKKEIGTLETHMELQFEWGVGNHHVDVTLMIRNQSSQVRDYTFVAQDAAYMWFPNQAQIDLEPFLFDSAKRLPDRFRSSDGV